MIESILTFSLAYGVKGGWLGKIPGFNALREKPYLDTMLDGKPLSAAIVSFYAGMCGLPLWMCCACALAWLIGVAPSMGEEAGAVGTYKGGWGPYVDNPEFGRSYGVKKAIQRGVFTGAPLALVTGNIWFIAAGATFPIVYFCGMSLRELFTRNNSWDWAELIYGGMLGLAWALSI